MRVIGNPYGEFRGKMGGTVFSKNKSGAIARVYSIPVNRNSDAQRNQRAQFGSTAMQWAEVLPVSKQQWNGFASDAARFNPLKGTNTGQFSGFNAFQSLSSVVQYQNRQTYNDWQINSIPMTNTNLAIESLPPSTALVGNLKFSDGIICEMKLGEVFVTAGSACVVNIKLSQDTGIPQALDKLKDSNGNEVGFALYRSDTMLNGQTRPKNYLYQKIFTTGTLAFSEEGESDLSNLQLTGLVDLTSYSDLRAGTVVYTLYQVGKSGAIKQIASTTGEFMKH